MARLGRYTPNRPFIHRGFHGDAGGADGALPVHDNHVLIAVAGARTNLSFTAPTGAGTLLVVQVNKENTAAITPPTGFVQKSQVATNAPSQHTVFYGWTADTGAGPYNFTWTGSTFAGGSCHRVSGAIGTGDPWDAFSHQFQNTSTGGVGPAVSLTTTGANRLLFFGAIGINGSSTWTPPSGFTELFESINMTADILDDPTAGGTGSLTATFGTETGQMAAFLGAIKPTVVAGGGDQTVSPAGILSSEAVGDHDVIPGAVTVAPAYIPSGELVGAVAVSAAAATQTINAAGIPSAEQFGSAALAQSISAAGIPSAQAFGNAAATPGAVTVSAAGISTGAAFGTAVVALSGAPQTITASGIPSSEKFGTALVGQAIAAAGIPSQEQVSTQDSPDTYSDGFGKFSINLNVAPTGIVSDEVFGNSVTAISGAPQTVTASGIPSSERFGAAALAQSITAASIESREAFGAVVATPGTATISAYGIPSAERFGTVIAAIAAAQSISVAGIPSQEAFGAVAASIAISAAGIPSQERLGNAAATPGAVTISAAGIPSAGAFGMPSAVVTVTINAAGIPPAERFGVTALSQAISAYGIPSGERVGNTSLIPATIFITAAGIPSVEAHGSHLVVFGIIVIPSIDYEAVAYITVFEAVVDYAYDASASPNQFESILE